MCRAVARRLLFAKKVVNSPLVKTAIHGADPNWGRLVMAVGKPSPAAGLRHIAPEDLVISMQEHTVYDRGVPLDTDLGALSRKLEAAATVRIEISIGQPGSQSDGLGLRSIRRVRRGERLVHQLSAALGLRKKP